MSDMTECELHSQGGVIAMSPKYDGRDPMRNRPHSNGTETTMTIKRYGLDREYSNNIGVPAIKEMADGAYVRLEDHQRLMAGYKNHNDLMVLRTKKAEGAQPSVPEGWAVKRVGDAIHIEHPNGQWCGYMLSARGGPAHDLTYDFLIAMLTAAPILPADGQAQRDEPCEHSDHVRPADCVCIECGEVAQQDADKADAQPATLIIDRADRPGFEKWAKSHGGLSLTPMGDNFEANHTLIPGTYFYKETEIAWRAWGNKPTQPILEMVLEDSIDERKHFDAWFFQTQGPQRYSDTTFIDSANIPWKAWEARSKLTKTMTAPKSVPECNGSHDYSAISSGVASECTACCPPVTLKPDPAMAGDDLSDDDIQGLLSEFGDHHTEHGRIVYDKWTLLEAGRALLKRVQPASGDVAACAYCEGREMVQDEQGNIWQCPQGCTPKNPEGHCQSCVGKWCTGRVNCVSYDNQPTSGEDKPCA